MIYLYTGLEAIGKTFDETLDVALESLILGKHMSRICPFSGAAGQNHLNYSV